jgi:para-nitrobenzyl esterase
MSIKPVVVAVFILGLAACSNETPDHDGKERVSVSLAQGEVMGIPSPYDDDITVYRGLPYAAAPIGELRWQPPQAATGWDGVRVADTFADSCFQLRHTSNFVWRREGFPVSEDCLSLNVWAPDNAEDLPVMVWFHGGAHTSGQGHSLIFDGTTLAQQGVVVVTVNYRLGPFGFLAHPWLSEAAESGASGNYGLMDKIAALSWVKDNAVAMGGDPNNITIFGQSAGSQSVCSLMVSPSAQGLFHKAIGQSAACVNPLSVEDASGHLRGSALVESLGADSFEALQAADPDALLSAMVD